MHPSYEIEREYVCRVRAPEGEGAGQRRRSPARAASRWKTARRSSTRSSASAAAIRTTGSRCCSTKAATAKCAACGNRRAARSAASSACATATSTLPRLLSAASAWRWTPTRWKRSRKQFGLENNAPVLTLQPVIGQRKSRPMEIRVGKDRAQNSLRQWPHQRGSARTAPLRPRPRRKPRGRGRPGAGPGRGKPGGYKGAGGKPFSGPMGADRPSGARPPRGGKPFGGKPTGAARATTISAIESMARRRAPAGDRPFAPRGPRPQGDRPFNDRGPRPQGDRGPRAGAPGGMKGKPHSASRPPAATTHNTAEFRSWYVPEGVETGSKVAPPRGPRPGAPRPYGDRGPRPGAPQGPRGPGRRVTARSASARRQPVPGPRSEAAGDAPPVVRARRATVPMQPRGPKVRARLAIVRRARRVRQGDRPFNDRGPRPDGNRGPRHNGPQAAVPQASRRLAVGRLIGHAKKNPPKGGFFSGARQATWIRSGRPGSPARPA